MVLQFYMVFTWFYRKDGGLNIGICLKIGFASKTLGI